ncbi:MAG: nucleotidyltransferase domain-containing protein [Nitrospirota bacterium]
MIKFERLPHDILSRLPGAQDLLMQDENVIFAYLFGSLAGGAPKPLSDVDIAVYLLGTKNFAEYKLQLFDRLSAVLGTSELDLVILNTAPVSLSGRILQHRRVLVDKEPFRRHAYESNTLREFFDFRTKEGALLTRRYGIGR